jgi:hypothetical protein
MQHRQILIGGLTWLSVLTATGLAIHSQFSEKPQGLSDVVGGIGRWVSGAPEEYLAVSAVKLVLAPGDPVFLKMPDGDYRQVGRVRNHFGPTERILPAPGKIASLIETPTLKATVVLYDDEVNRSFPDGFMLEYHTSPTALDWVVKTMITPERQKEIAEIVATDWQRHREQIASRLQPIVETSIARTVEAIEAELPAVLNSHQGDFAKLADRYQSEIIRRQIVPLVREEILPIVQEEVRPLATELGKDLWDRVSLWSFTWRYLYDVSPLPEKNAVKLEFDRFMKDEVTPALESRSDDFVAVTERILRRISRNEKVRAVIRESLKKVATDDDLQTIVWSIVQEAVINNQTLRTSLRDYWASDEVQDAMNIASTSFEPTARAVGDAMFGSREAGITPEFSRVLRAQILMKDRRWFVLVPKLAEIAVQPQPPVDGLIMYAGLEPMPFPIEFEGTDQSPLTQLQNPLPEITVP